jgi:hypothetical protein
MALPAILCRFADDLKIADHSVLRLLSSNSRDRPQYALAPREPLETRRCALITGLASIRSSG